MAQKKLRLSWKNKAAAAQMPAGRLRRIDAFRFLQ